MTAVASDRAPTLPADRRSVLTALEHNASQFSLGAFNGSQLTLIAPLPTAHAVLVYSADNNIHSTIYYLGVPVYRFRTNGTGTKTDVFRVTVEGLEELIVTYDRRVMGAVLIRPDGQKLRVSRYLRPAKAGSTRAMKFDWEGTTYEWRIDILGKMALFIEGARMDEPIAWHNRHKKVVVDGTPMLRPAAMGLGVDASRLPFRDQIVISWMLVSERTTIAAPV